MTNHVHKVAANAAQRPAVLASSKRQHSPAHSCLAPCCSHLAPTSADAIVNMDAAAVAPKFKDSFKEDLDWREIYQALAATGVKQVEAAEAYAKSKRCARCAFAQHACAEATSTCRSSSASLAQPPYPMECLYQHTWVALACESSTLYV